MVCSRLLMTYRVGKGIGSHGMQSRWSSLGGLNKMNSMFHRMYAGEFGGNEGPMRKIWIE
jgi:hypothetical protein